MEITHYSTKLIFWTIFCLIGVIGIIFILYQIIKKSLKN